MDIQINYMAVLWAALASLVLGVVWYSKPVLGKEWEKMAKLRDKDVRMGMEASVIQGALASLATAYVLALMTDVVHQVFANSYLLDAMNTAFWAWFGFVATTLIIHNAVEVRRKKLTLISLTFEFVRILVMGGIIGFLQP